MQLKMSATCQQPKKEKEEKMLATSHVLSLQRANMQLKMSATCQQPKKEKEEKMLATSQPTQMNNDRTLAEVTIDGHRIATTVTHSAVIVAGWINETVQGRSVLVGLEVACQANGNIVLIQLCVGNRCLIYQLLHRWDGCPPGELFAFLNNPRFWFVGAGVEEVACRLQGEHGFSVRNKADLGVMAATSLGREDLRRAGLERLAREVMQVEMEKKPVEVWSSDWGQLELSQEQIAYACADAFVSFELGRILFR